MSQAERKSATNRPLAARSNPKRRDELPGFSRWFALAALLMVSHWTAVGAAAALEGEEAVEAGRQALNQFWEYPWYDKQKDEAKPIDVTPPPPPPPPSNWSFNWSGVFTFLQYLGWTVFVLLIALMIFLMLRAEWTRLSALAKKDEKPGEVGPAQPDRVEALPFKVATSNKDFYSTAEEYYLAGDYSTAIIYLYSFKLLQLDKAQIIHLTRGKTNRQYLRETRRFSSAGPLLEPTMTAFEEVFFGHRSLGRERFEACWQVAPRFRELLAQSPPQPRVALA